MSKAELLVLLGGQRETLSRQYGVKSLAVFGSAARDAMSATSDIDVLVEFDTPPGFDRYFDLKFFLEELIGRPVDLVTRGGLRNELRARVEAEAINVA
jgi:predicted nucleotidyltransferase